MFKLFSVFPVTNVKYLTAELYMKKLWVASLLLVLAMYFSFFTSSVLYDTMAIHIMAIFIMSFLINTLLIALNVG
jgi:hypothetical protein